MDNLKYKNYDFDFNIFNNIFLYLNNIFSNTLIEGNTNNTTVQDNGYIYEFINERRNVTDHESRAQVWGGNVVSIHSDEENNIVKNLMLNNNANTIVLGGTRFSNQNLFTWFDNTPFDYHNWNSGEPNNWNGRENNIQMYSDGQWNDTQGDFIGPSVFKKHIIPPQQAIDNAVRSASTSATIASGSAKNAIRASKTSQTNSQTAVQSSINAINAANGAQTAIDAAQIAASNAENAAGNAVTTLKSAQAAAGNAQNSANDAQGIANNIQNDLSNISLSVDHITTLAEQAPGTSAAQRAASLVGINNVQTFTNMRESMVGNKSDIFDSLTAREYIDTLKNSINEDINDKLINSSYNRASEIIAQDNNIINNILFDYLINKEDGSNIEKVYKDLKQKNIDDLRNIQIKSYYSKAYKEYIFILKVVITLIALLIPIIFLNKYEFIDKNISLTIIFFIIIIGILFISYRLYLLHLKDNINYDKIKIPYDRQSSQLIKQKKMKSKGSIFKNLGVTCIGDECCDASMVYDNLRNKCILSENFGNFFEHMQNNETKINIIEPYNNNKSSQENFATRSSKNQLLTESLANSQLNRMQF